MTDFQNDTVSDLTDELADAQEVISVLADALEAVEWREGCAVYGLADPKDPEMECPSCQGVKPDHATENYPPDGLHPCQLAAALVRGKAAR